MRPTSLNRWAATAAAAPLALASCIAHAFDITAASAPPPRVVEAPADGSPVMPDRRPGSIPEAKPKVQAGNLSLDESGAQYRNESRDGRLHASIGRDWGSAGGLRLGIDYARLLSDRWAVGFNGVAGIETQEVMFNGLYSLRPDFHIGASLGWLRDTDSYQFHSGPDDVAVAQTSALVRAIKRFDQHRWLTEVNASAYIARAHKPDVPDAAMIEDSPTTIRVLLDPREISPGRLHGFNLGVGLTPWPNAELKLSLGRESLQYRFQDGSSEKTGHTTAGLGYTHTLSNCWEVEGNYNTGATGDRASFGLRHGIWNVSLSHDSGAAGMKGRTRLQAGIEVPMGAAPPRCGSTGPKRAAEVRRLDEVFQRPRELPSRVLAKVDLTALPTLFATMDKAQLPGVTVGATADALVLRMAVPATVVYEVYLNGVLISNVGSDGQPLVWAQDGALYIGVRRFPNPGAGVTVPAQAVFGVNDPVTGPSISSATFDVQGF